MKRVGAILSAAVLLLAILLVLGVLDLWDKITGKALPCYEP